MIENLFAIFCILVLPFLLTWYKIHHDRINRVLSEYGPYYIRDVKVKPNGKIYCMFFRQNDKYILPGYSLFGSDNHIKAKAGRKGNTSRIDAGQKWSLEYRFFQLYLGNRVFE